MSLFGGNDNDDKTKNIGHLTRWERVSPLLKDKQPEEMDQQSTVVGAANDGRFASSRLYEPSRDLQETGNFTIFINNLRKTSER